jgi:hypothetical protein
MKDKMVHHLIRHVFKAAIIMVFLFQSAWTQSQGCSYILNMHDSYGDGWNGGYLAVFINGELVGNYYASNFGSIADFQISDGDALELYYTPGDYENENSYQLYDPAWNFLLGDGPNPQTGNVYSSAGYPQHPYSIETCTAEGENNSVPLLGMPAENDWLLLSNYKDRSLIRNTLAYFESTDGSGWAYHINDCPADNYSCSWYIRLFQNTTFTDELRCAYENYRLTILDRARINKRLQWLDENIPGLCPNIYIGDKQQDPLRFLLFFPFSLT